MEPGNYSWEVVFPFPTQTNEMSIESMNVSMHQAEAEFLVMYYVENKTYVLRLRFLPYFVQHQNTLFGLLNSAACLWNTQ